MTELQINFSVFAVSGVLPLFPGALLFWVTERYTALCHCCTYSTWAADVCCVCVPGWYRYPYTASTDVASFQAEREVDKRTCVARTTCF